MIKKWFWAIAYRLYAIRLGLQGCGKIKLASRVIYKGKEYSVNNWASGPIVHLISLDGERRSDKAPFEELRRVRSWREWKHAFYFTYSWWMTSHYKSAMIRKQYPELFKQEVNNG